ncbi:MAG: hypothetical protein INR71_00720 [Terriglobus roseus]|nr:hypothetical protein [Terriglobus roseus]
MAVVKSNRSVQYGIFAVMALLLLAAIFHASGSSHAAAPWAYKGKAHANFEQHSAEKTGQYDDDFYDDEAEEGEDKQAPLSSSALADHDEDAPNTSGGNGKWAYATFLATREDDQPDDQYFTATRALVYQLLHHPKTKTERNIPLLVLAPPHAHKRKLDMLTDEGATVIKVSPMDVPEDWMNDDTGMRASAAFARLRMWELKNYQRILYIDPATLLMRPIDKIWDEAMVASDMRVRSTIEAPARFDKMEGAPPKKYFMAGVSDAKNSKHPFPPKDDDWMSPGFYMLKPDVKVFRYFESLLKDSGSFDRNRLMAGLLNHAHRRDGQ